MRPEDTWDPRVEGQMVVGALAGAALGGACLWVVSSGTWPLPYLGQLAASGAGPATFAGAGVGAALGGFVAGALGLRLLPAALREPGQADAGRVRVVRDGLFAGLCGAAAYWLLAHLLAVVSLGRSPEDASRWMATIVLGEPALYAGSVAEMVGWGWVGHLVASLPWGPPLAWVARDRPFALADPVSATVVSMLYGVLVWLANVHVVAPLLGMTWFRGHDALTLLLAHLAFGLGAGAYLHTRTRPRRP